jgi:hypothetical protein
MPSTGEVCSIAAAVGVDGVLYKEMYRGLGDS